MSCLLKVTILANLILCSSLIYNSLKSRNIKEEFKIFWIFEEIKLPLPVLSYCIWTQIVFPVVNKTSQMLSLNTLKTYDPKLRMILSMSFSDDYEQKIDVYITFNYFIV